MTVIAAKRYTNSTAVACDSQVTVADHEIVSTGPKWYFTHGQQWDPNEGQDGAQTGLVAFAVTDSAVDTFLALQKGIPFEIPKTELLPWVTRTYLPLARELLADEYGGVEECVDLFEACELLVVTAEEMVYCPNLRTALVPMTDYFAIGTGAAIAKGRMDVGDANYVRPEHAVASAIKWDTTCGGMIHTHHFVREQTLAPAGGSLLA